MWPLKHKKLFTLLDDTSEEELKKGLLSENIEVKHTVSRSFKIHAAFLFLHVMVAVFWVSTLRMIPSSPMLLLPLELPGVSEAVEYETVKFQVSGGGTREHPATIYEGPPTPEKDMRWWKLVNVGFIVLTPEMNETLRYPTESVSKDNQTPLVGLEVFHQLHCLNSIRRVVYGTDQYFNPFDRQDQIHLDHCLDYLRQVLMCHADVTPISNKKRPKGYNPLLGEWMPDFATHHTCRNFDKIHAWAAKYNTSGFTLEPWPGVDPGQGLRTQPKPTAHVGGV